MKPPRTKRTSVKGPDRQPACDLSAVSNQADNDAGSIADLTDVVEKALAIADTLKLSLVGIELCSALEQIKRINGAGELVTRHDLE